MAIHPKCHLTQNLLILVSYTAAIVAVSTLTLPLLASSQLDFKRLCVGPNPILQICVGAKHKLANSVSLAAITTGGTNARAFIHNSEDIAGPLPTDFGFCKLSYLAVANNKLTGPITPSVGHLQGSLLEIVLQNNQLSGCLPHELGMLNKAVVIDAGMNKLTGPIPSSFSCLSRVEQLNLAGNRLYGPVPEALCKLAGPTAGRLVNLTLDGNYFTSVGPACTALIKDGVLDVKNNCIPGFANQRRRADCVAFQSQTKPCPEVSNQVSCPGAVSTDAAVPEERKARGYYSYLTYASLRE